MNLLERLDLFPGLHATLSPLADLRPEDLAPRLGTREREAERQESPSKNGSWVLDLGLPKHRVTVCLKP